MAEQQLATQSAESGDVLALSDKNIEKELTEGEGNVVVPPAAKVTEFMSQPAVQRAIPAIIAIALLAVSLVIYSFFMGSGHRTIFENLSDADRAAVYAALQEAGIDAQIQQGTGVITVSEDDYYRSKMLLASQGLPKSTEVGGFEMIRGEQSLGTSQFMEMARYRLAI